MTNTEITIPAGQDVQRIADALNAAQMVGVKFAVGPNPHLRWDSITQRYVPFSTGNLDDDFPATWEGGHALVIEYGDCELYARCQCGEQLGMATPNKPLDRFAGPWERHVMNLPRR